MMTYAMMMKSLLVVAIVVTGHGSAVEKLPTPCCTKVNRQEITEEILDFEIQTKDGHCVNAAIFTTATGRYCSSVREPWVYKKIQALRNRQLAESAATRSLLKTLTTRSPPPPAFSTTGSLLKAITARPSPPPAFSATPSSFVSERPQTRGAGQ